MKKSLFLKSSQIEQYVSLLEENAIVSKTDTHGVITFVNQRFCDISGYTENELIGQNHRIVNSGIHAEYFFKEMWDTIFNGKIWIGEICNRAKNNQLYWVSSTIVPIFDENGKIEQYISVRHEITEKKLREEQLFRLWRLESIERITAGIAHDFNNILTMILGGVEVIHFLAEDKDGLVQNSNQIFDMLDKVTRAGWRAADLIKKMLAYCRQENHSRENLPLVNVEHTIFESLNVIKNLKNKIVIKTEIKKPIFIRIQEAELNQILFNLLVNACDAMKQEGILTVTLDKIECTENHYCCACSKMLHGQFVKISIHDNGCGIEKKLISRIFDPFFTTKDVSKGTGLGLSVVSGVVHKFAGHINVQSEIGIGTTFSVLFPLQQGD